MYGFRSLAALTVLMSAPAFAYDGSCGEVVWSAEHGHYHCVGGPAVVYEAPPPRASSVYVDLSYNAYPGYGYPRYAYPYRPWYGPAFYIRPVFAFGRPYYHGHGRYWHHGRWW